MSGNLFHNAVKPLSEFIFKGIGEVYKYPKIDSDLIQRLLSKGGRTLLVEGEVKFGTAELRVDLLEVNFGAQEAIVIDLTSIDRAAHIAKNYTEALQDFTGFGGDAIEMRYVGDNNELLETLVEVLLEAGVTSRG